MKAGLTLLVALLLVGAAMADLSTTAVGAPGSAVVPRTTLGNPYDGTTTYGAAAQDFETTYDAYDIWVCSEFTTTTALNLGAVSAVGFQNDTSDGTGANFRIYSGAPWSGGSIVLSASGGYDHLYSAGLVGADFGNQLLPAGSYYMVFQAVRAFATTGQSYVFDTTLGNNNDRQWNPGGGFGQGTNFPIVDASSAPIDINWQLEATPEPASLSLLVLGGLALLRRR